jgi:hypothetical protein
MSEKYSDVIIVGTDLAGLITGAFLAKRGLSVTVLNFERDVASEKKNIQPNLITNLESRLFKSILGRLSILDHELQIIRRLEVPFQVVLPRHRIDIFRDRDRLHKEIQREFPSDKISLAAFYENVDHFDTTLDTERLQELILPKTFRSRWKFSQFVKQTGLNQRIKEATDSLGSNREVQALLECQVKFLSQTHSENPFLYQIAKTLSTDNCMLFEVQGGLGHLKKLFLDKIEQFSGKVKNEVRIEGFQFEKRHLRSIQLGGFEGALGCKYLLWNDEVRGIKEFLPKKFRNRRLVKKIKSIQPKFYHFSIQYELDPNVIPVGMRENLLFIGDPEQPLTGVNFLHLNLFHRPGEDGETPPTLLTVSYLLEAERLQEPAEFFQAIHKDISAILHRLLPFSEQRIRLSFPLSQPRSGEPGTLFPMEKSDFEIFRENASANPVYQLAPQRFGDLFPINNRTAYKNLFLTSPEILAALGSEGKFLLGLKTIDLIWGEVETSRKKVIKQRKIA